jgi:hypothetical protein
MYRLYRLGSTSDPDELWLHYEWRSSFDNTEWRPCVEHFLNEVAVRGHQVVAIPSVPFEPGEDFVEIGYLLDGTRVNFSSDLLLSLITITMEDQSILRSVWNDIGDTIGWRD